MKKYSAKSSSGSSIVMIVVIIVVLLVGGYLGYAYVSKTGLFGNPAAKANNQASNDPIVIKKVAQNGDILSIDLTKNIKDDGYCILTLQGTRSLLTIDDSKNKDEKFKDCTGWTIGAKDLLKGDYTATVKLVTKKDTYSASKSFKLN